MEDNKQELVQRNSNADLVQGYQDYKLPCLDTYTEQKVAHAVNELYRGYTPPEAESIKTLEQVVAYIKEREMVHGETMGRVVTGATKTRGVINACRWDLGHIIDVAMKNGDFGDSVVSALSKELGVTEQEVHALRQVHLSMTRVEAYVLGLYGASITTTMRIATIQDEDVRRRIISDACNSGVSVMDGKAMERMRNKMLNAIRVALLPTTTAVLGDGAEDTDDDVSEPICEDKPIITAQEDNLATILKTVEKIISDMKPWRSARVDRDCDILTGYDPTQLDMGNEKIDTLNSRIGEALEMAARELNDAEDYIKALREAVDSAILVGSGDASDEGDTEDPE